MSTSSETGTKVRLERKKVEESYNKFIRKKIKYIILSFVIILIIAGIAVVLGCFPLSVSDVYSIIFHGLSTETLGEESVWLLRLPRIILALLVGFGLAAAGTMMQGTLKNPLASPFTLGIAAGAAFGASLALYLAEGAVVSEYLLVGCAFFFALIPTFVIMLLTHFRRATPETMVLAGIGMLYLFGAFQGLVQFISSPTTVQAAVIFGVGTLARASWAQVIPAAIVIICFIPLLMWKAWDVNILDAGDEAAESMGVNTARTRVLVMVITTILTAGLVCFTGPIGFIGLITPHICRMFMGGDNRFLIPVAGFFGAALLLAADTVARTVIAPESIPVGIVVSLIAGPLFLIMLLRKKGGYL
uniref:Cobalamin import system permease protein BtuC n=1 Tax=Candidatus Methanophaga sp. ANME-1 ERB7 TaxID=2759913 RepID=A0A7G9ZCJ3_9EURY|nr:vitamin B12 import system permease protein BtuC [Methanosarcinales archaeon ANME-1 ERB7]